MSKQRNQPRKKWFRRKRVWLPLLFIAFLFLGNSSYLAKEPEGEPFLLAHRGMAQTFHMENITNETCTAERIYPPEHPYLENTLPSMQAAFDAGADVVELDVQWTKDNRFAVFHDWTLDCRTNGTGVTRDYTLAELQQLDIGYHYTADEGKTFPFRGKGIGMMPSLDDVLQTFPDRSLLIHIKSNDPLEGKALADVLARLPAKRLAQLSVYGGDEPIQTLKQQLPQLRVMSMATMKSCLIPYIAAGWSGYVPEACAQTQLHIPDQIAPWLWGWPNRFMARMEAKDTRVILVAGSGDVSQGFDVPTDLKRVPESFTGGIWTNRIDLIGPAFHENAEK
ncbi:glycerophosphodiester phosphodiesterase family protein [Brevibacillus formosus]|uniref:Glycerophosphodiester phosphodiesterase n=1 Tax=Brevibacillus formosus TaxID=54913 RepID=A0A837KS64_9BACL|nr:glycerophosphodiester phosphodiesterase family protein [Brevibacillus formosus]KLI00488.1 glycerophosphodiester phosphodiesterase [Brevibacillus formosus]MED1958801.1 glycerophosphodiester phosphodiesterase family protein [Brevibacillus formosus]PSJ92485.1 glycerophosphodiester phosphodiesterase [Brevibacillus formosus]GED57875.1 glycerophosphoryl diester phosphodiesterase [Brevibacillus formosus]